MRQQHNLWLLP